jgi:hypothetical protein
MSVATPATPAGQAHDGCATEVRVHFRRLRYAAHVVSWSLTAGLGTYGSVAYAAPNPSQWVAPRPRWWRREARDGLAECEHFLTRALRPEPTEQP